MQLRSDDSNERDTLASLLTDLGYAPTPNGANALDITSDRIVSMLTIIGGELSMTCAMRSAGADWDLSRVNEANTKVRFARFCVSRGDLQVKADFTFDPSVGDALPRLECLLGLWNDAVGVLISLAMELTPA